MERDVGETKWSFWGLMRYALVEVVVFSMTPLASATLLCIAFCVLVPNYVLVKSASRSLLCCGTSSRLSAGSTPCRSARRRVQTR